jgi:hypothetical protein
MCKDGRCGHFAGLQDEWAHFASLDPVMVTGEKLHAAIEAQNVLDRFIATEEQAREEFTTSISQRVRKGELKLSEAIRHTEERAERINAESKQVLENYTQAMDAVLEGTPLAGLFGQTVLGPNAEVKVQVNLGMADKFGIGIFHRKEEEDESFDGEIPDVVRQFGEQLAASIPGLRLEGIVAVPVSKK